MSFKLGDKVYVIPMRRNGEITKITPSGEYRVTLDTGVVRCREEQLQIAAKETKKKGDPDKPPSNSITVTSDAVGSGSMLRTLDLHGMTVAQAIRAVEEHISRGVMANLGEIEIQHGLGSGALKKAVHELLPKLSAVKNFAVKEFNPGVTRVFL